MCRVPPFSHTHHCRFSLASVPGGCRGLTLRTALHSSSDPCMLLLPAQSLPELPSAMQNQLRVPCLSRTGVAGSEERKIQGLGGSPAPRLCELLEGTLRFLMEPSAGSSLILSLYCYIEVTMVFVSVFVFLSLMSPLWLSLWSWIYGPGHVLAVASVH